MDFVQNINGMSRQKTWKELNTKTSSGNKKFENEEKPIEEAPDGDTRKFKDQIIDLQENVKITQDKINILQIASESLNDISSSLNEIKEMALETLNQLDDGDHNLSKEIQNKLDNIDKLQNLQKNFEGVLDQKDKNYSNIVQEFKRISDLTIKIAKIQGFDQDLNENSHVQTVVDEISQTLSSVSTTKTNLEKVKSDLITNIKSLNITLENMLSSYSRIRSVKLASEKIKLTQDQILSEAMRSISIQIKEADTTITKLIS
jgi:flagellin